MCQLSFRRVTKVLQACDEYQLGFTGGTRLEMEQKILRFNKVSAALAFVSIDWRLAKSIAVLTSGTQDGPCLPETARSQVLSDLARWSSDKLPQTLVVLSPVSITHRESFIHNPFFRPDVEWLANVCNTSTDALQIRPASLSTKD